MNMAQKIVKVENPKAGPSSAAQAGYDRFSLNTVEK